jgi:RNA polymerase sigma-70 factor, ECF subfamily
VSERRPGLFDGCPGDFGDSSLEDRVEAVVKWIEAQEHPLLIRTLRLLGPVATHEDAEDTLQELCVRLPKILGRHSAERPLGPFLATCHRNLCADVRKKLKRRRKVEVPHPVRRRDEGEAVPVDFEDGSPDANPGCRADAADLCRALDRTLKGLPEHQRRVWELRELDGLSYAEIATRLGVPRGSVAVWLNRARARVASEMGEHMRKARAEEQGGSA